MLFVYFLLNKLIKKIICIFFMQRSGSSFILKKLFYCLGYCSTFTLIRSIDIQNVSLNITIVLVAFLYQLFFSPFTVPLGEHRPSILCDPTD
jgi:hypothetical protein